MENLLYALSKELQNKLTDFVINAIWIECGEVYVRSEYDMDPSFYEAIEKELLGQAV